MTLLIAVAGYLLIGAMLGAACRYFAGPPQDALQYMFLAFFWPVLIAGALVALVYEIRAERRVAELKVEAAAWRASIGR